MWCVHVRGVCVWGGGGGGHCQTCLCEIGSGGRREQETIYRGREEEGDRAAKRERERERQMEREREVK
jgi:hypothetical protein